MLTAIACVYGRILNTRLVSWIMVSDEQTAYQKGKSILNHLFTIRLLIELAKASNITLCLRSRLKVPSSEKAGFHRYWQMYA